jgi:hypothetical protein
VWACAAQRLPTHESQESVFQAPNSNTFALSVAAPKLQHKFSLSISCVWPPPASPAPVVFIFAAMPPPLPCHAQGVVHGVAPGQEAQLGEGTEEQQEAKRQVRAGRGRGPGPARAAFVSPPFKQAHRMRG